MVRIISFYQFFYYRNVVKWGASGRLNNHHGLDGLMRENSDCGKQCRSESMRAELRLLRQPFFFLLHFFPITLHIFSTRQLKTVPQTATRKRLLKKGNWRCFKLHRLSVQFSASHLSKIGEFSQVQ